MANQGPQRQRRRRSDSLRYEMLGVKLSQRDLILLGCCMVLICIAAIGCMASGHAEKPSEKPSEPPVLPPNVENPAPDPFQITQDNIYLEVGGQITLSTSGGEGDITWSSADGAVATVADGVVTGVSEGSTTITAVSGEESAACLVTVSPPPVPVPELYLNHTDFTLRPEYPPEQMRVKVKETREIYEGEVLWASADPQVATVSETGLVERVGRGTTTITATIGNQVLECIVRVR